jgi:hypothetical protein
MCVHGRCAVIDLQATVITFSNKSAYRVRALWIDFSGNEVRQAVVASRQHTICSAS